MYYVEMHFTESSLSNILAHKLNLRFIHHKDLPHALESIVRATNASCLLNVTQLPLHELISRLLIQQRISFLPTAESLIYRTSVMVTLHISSFFAATSNTQHIFSLYELLVIPFQHHNTRICPTNIPYIIGIGDNQTRLIIWMLEETDTCDFKAISTCRETSPILTH